MRKILGFFLLLIFVLLLVFFINPSRREQVIKLAKGEGDLRGQLELISQAPLGDPPLDMDLVGPNLVMWYGNRVKFVASNGESLNNREVLLNNPVISVGDSVSVVYDRGGENAYILNSKGKEIGHLEGLRNIRNANPINGIITTVERTSQGEILKYISYDGVELFNKEIKNKHFSSYSSSENNNYYIMGSFYATGLDMVSNLMIYDRDGEEVVKQNVDGVVMAVYIDYKGRYFYLTEKDLYKGNLGQEQGSEVSLFKDILKEGYQGDIDIKSISFGKTIGILTNDRLVEIDYDGNLLTNSLVVGGYTKLEVYGQGFLLKGDNSYKIIEFGEEILDQPLEDTRVFTNGSSIVLVSPEGIMWNEVKYSLE